MSTICRPSDIGKTISSTTIMVCYMSRRGECAPSATEAKSIMAWIYGDPRLTTLSDEDALAWVSACEERIYQ